MMHDNPRTSCAPVRLCSYCPVTAERDMLAEQLRQRDEQDNARRAAVPETIGGIRFAAAERALIGLLARRDLVTRQAFLAETARPGASDDDRGEHLLDTLLCKLRPRLARLGLDVEAVRGEGVRLSASMRRSLRTMFEAERRREPT